MTIDSNFYLFFFSKLNKITTFIFQNLSFRSKNDKNVFKRFQTFLWKKWLNVRKTYRKCFFLEAVSFRSSSLKLLKFLVNRTENMSRGIRTFSIFFLAQLDRTLLLHLNNFFEFGSVRFVRGKILEFHCMWVTFS